MEQKLHRHIITIRRILIICVFVTKRVNAHPNGVNYIFLTQTIAEKRANLLRLTLINKIKVNYFSFITGLINVFPANLLLPRN